MKGTTHTPSQAGNGTRMARYLSQIDVWAIAFGCIVGWGAFVMPGTTFLPVAGPCGTIIAMTISAIIMLVIGMNYAYLMSYRPGTGGVYTYTKEAFGRDHAFLCSWFLGLSYTSIVFLNATALFVVSRTLFGSTLQVGPHYQIAGYSVYLSEVALSTCALVVIGFLFINQKPLLQRLQTALAITLLVGSFVITCVCMPHLKDVSVLMSFGLDGGADAPAVIMTIVLLSPWAFVGFDVISLETAHFEFPIKKSGKLIALSILCGGFVYTAMSIVSVTSIPSRFSSWQEYIANLGDFTGVTAVPTFFAAQSVMGTFGLVIISITALAAIFTGIIGAYRATTRVLSTMAEDGIVPVNFSSTSFCITFTMVISVVVSFLGRNALEWFVELTTFGAIVGFGYTSMSAFVLARREGNRRIALTGLAGAAITIAFAVVQMIPRITSFETIGAESFLMLSIWCLLGFIFYWKTMSQTTLGEHGGYFTSSTVLFSLLLYSVLMWYILHLLEVTGQDLHLVIIQNSIVLIAIVFTGLLVMLYVQSLLRKRQDELERDMIRAEEGSRAKSQFLFNMSHDIRTPMNAIIGLTELARRSDATMAEKDDYLDRIESSGQQLLAIINDVLDMSRIESGKMELLPEPTNLHDVLRDLHDLFALQMEGKGLVFTTDSSAVSDPWVSCDRNRLSRMLLNLVSNAYKFTNEGDEVSVTLRQLGRDGDLARYELVVRDTGIGMSQEFVEHMFTPFERERTSTVSGIQGTGLGLSITKSIVDQMGGTIDVVTELGQGTTFVMLVDLPVLDEQEKNEQERLAEETDLTGTHLLLVEDIDINRQIAQMILEQHGCTVEVATNGQEALDMVRASEPGTYAAVLMDIQMPIMDGYEATRAIRKLDDKRLASIPIIAMTANAFKEDELSAAEAGMQAHIAKPLEVDKMMETIAGVLHGHTA